MACNRLNDCLDAYLDGDIAASELEALEEHVRGCPVCTELLVRERRMERALREHPVAEPGDEFFEKALVVSAASDSARDRRRSRWAVGAGSALAAGLAIWLAVIPQLRTPEPPVSPVATVTLALHETRTIKLVFGSETEIQHARLSLSLPPGVELAGHEGRQEIHWKTSLHPGKNVLPLELILQEGSGGDIVARLEQKDKQKTFVVRIALASPHQGLNSLKGSQHV